MNGSVMIDTVRDDWQGLSENGKSVGRACAAGDTGGLAFPYDRAVARVVRMTDRMRGVPGVAGVSVAEFIHLPVGVSIRSLTLEPGAELVLTKGDDDGEGLFVTHGTGRVTSEHGSQEEIVAGNIVYFDFDPKLVLGTDAGMIVLHIRGGFLMPGPRP
ncbi:hypothetical protein [Dactylosporangium sp. NPDC048998]|uniref:hypothetical protein n=1 Tax=Dactylosporangium sp. NPDC048998 TaxID=3363976 RepID=UPI00371096D0